jgi:hypothetical protein
MKEPTYSRAEQRERMRDFEAHVKTARESWRRGEAYVILSFKEYLELTTPRVEITMPQLTVQIAKAMTAVIRDMPKNGRT